MSQKRLQIIIDLRFERNFLQKRWAAFEWAEGGRGVVTSLPRAREQLLNLKWELPLPDTS